MDANRVFPPTAPRFGLISRTTSERMVLPLKGVQCDFAVQGGLVEVAMTQIFRQENLRPLDCDYLFPLPADAAVYSCEADINGRLITAMVRERGEAVRLAAEQKAAGSRVMLVEAERENLFTLTLSNLQPDDLIVVRLKYVQPLRFLADRPSVEIPFCPGVRYIPGNPLLRTNRGRGTVDDTDQVPDASRISPVRMDADHPDAAYIQLRGTLDGKFVEPGSLVSPSHNIISRVEAGMVSLWLSDKGEVPDRDFCLRWRERAPEALTSRAWLQEWDGECYALLEIRAPKAAADSAVPMDFYFLVDRSGSMAGIKWQKAVQAVQSCVLALGEDDRAMLTFFGSQFNDFAEQPLARGQLLDDANFQKLAQLPMAGGTVLGPAVSHVLQLSAMHSADRAKSLILITDAQVGNESDILKIMAPATGLPVHCFGIDLALNDALLTALARQQKGTFHSLNPADNVAKVVADLAQTIRHPVLTDLKLGGKWDAAAAFIPPLYSGQTYYMSARSPEKACPELTAQNGQTVRTAIVFDPDAATGQAPYLHWCRQRMQRDLDQHNNVDAIALSVKSNLICPLTAFIAWDDSEQVAVAQDSLAQPVFERPARLMESGFMSRGPQTLGCRASSGIHDADSEVQDLCMGTMLEAPARRNPLEIVVNQIVRHLRSSNADGRTAPIPIGGRQRVFTELFREICQRCHRLDWMPLGEQILAKTFERPDLAFARSNAVALLLADLLKLAGELESVRTKFLSQLSLAMQRQVEQTARQPNFPASPTITHFTDLFPAGGLSFTESARRTEPLRTGAIPAGLVPLYHLLDKGVRLELEIQEKLTHFSGSPV